MIIINVKIILGRWKQARNPWMVEKADEISKRICLRCKKGTLKTPGETFLKIRKAIFEKNPVAQWKSVGLNVL